MTALLSQHRDVRALKGPRLCTVGPGTAERLRRYSVVADAVPDEYRAEAVLGTLAAHGPLAGVRVLLPRSDIGREVIAEQLRSAGASVTDVTAYRTILDEVQREGDPDIYGMMLEGRIDIVTFTSASAVRNFVKVWRRPGGGSPANHDRRRHRPGDRRRRAPGRHHGFGATGVVHHRRSGRPLAGTLRKRACGKIEPMKVTSDLQAVADAAAAAAPADGSHSTTGARNTVDSGLRCLPAVRLRRRRRAARGELDARRLPVIHR